MKVLVLLILIFTTAFAQAMPYRCETHDNEGGKPLMMFKINPERDVTDKSGETWRKFLIGVTPSEGFRRVVYASGKISESGIGMTFVEDRFVIGYVKAFTKVEGGFEGDVSLSGVAHGQKLSITCLDLIE